MKTSVREEVRIHGDAISRRRFVQVLGAGALAGSALNLRELASLHAGELRRQGKSVILLWMAGGPSQFETFDPKPGHANGGPTEAIATRIPGIRIAAAWEQTAKVMGELAVIRSMTNREGSHPRATYQLHTGYIPSGGVKHPALASCIAKEIGDPESELPAVVSVGVTQGAGFLGVDYEPFVVNEPGELPANVAVPVSTSRYQRRLGLLDRLEGEFAARGGQNVVENHRKLYEKTSKLVLSPDVKAFDISSEPQALRDAYGDNDFGRGCLLARRLVEAGVTFVEVRSNGWDTHQDNFIRSAELADQVDPALAALISDLKNRGRLDRTLVVWLGEFGRTPRVNPRTGRDHYPRVFNAALGGCGVRGGQVIGASTADGTAVKDRPVTVPDLFTSICHAVNVDPRKENLGPLGRPLKIVDGGDVVKRLFG